MGAVGLFLYWLTTLFWKKKYLPLKSEIKAVHRKLVTSFRFLNLKVIINNNYDLKPIILKLFFVSLIINMFYFVFAIIAILFYNGVFIFQFIGYGFKESDSLLIWNWKIFLIINIIFSITLGRVIIDFLKLSFRSQYRNYYFKILVVDIITCNIISLIGTIIYLASKKQVTFPINNNVKIDKRSGFHDYSQIKRYLKLVYQLEIVIMIILGLIFLSFITLGHFVENSSLKLISASITFIIFILIFGWTIPRIINAIILRKMLKNLLVNENYYYLLSLIRFLTFTFGAYHTAVLINILKLNENSIELILANW